jgi:uncharacterized protein YeaO (DUF488 family)
VALRIVRLGTPRAPGEGLRIGTVRRPPRGVAKARFAADDWYDVWFPNLAPSAPLDDAARAAATDAQWRAFVRGDRAEMAAPGPTLTQPPEAAEAAATIQSCIPRPSPRSIQGGRGRRGRAGGRIGEIRRARATGGRAAGARPFSPARTPRAASR